MLSITVFISAYEYVGTPHALLISPPSIVTTTTLPTLSVKYKVHCILFDRLFILTQNTRILRLLSHAITTPGG